MKRKEQTDKKISIKEKVVEGFVKKNARVKKSSNSYRNPMTKDYKKVFIMKEFLNKE